MTAVFVALMSSAFAGTGIIMADDVVVRSKPSTESEKVGKLNKDEKVEVLGSSSNWFEVSSGSAKGYVRDDFIIVAKDESKSDKGEKSKKSKSDSGQKASVYYVIGDNVNVREGASTDAQKVAVKNAGDKLEVVAKKGDWLVTEVDGKKGYVRSDFVSTSKPKAPEPQSAPAPEPEAAFVEPPRPAFVVEQPQVFTTPVGDVLMVGNAGQQVAVLQQSLAYLGYFNGMQDGNFGADTAEAVFAFQTDNEMPANGIADIAAQQAIFEQHNLILAVTSFSLQFQGVPYRTGGRSPETGFDCSGFTRYVFSQFGIKLGASSGDQNQDGVQVSMDRARPGDLLTFGPSIHHVGLYLGNGEYIHSTKPGDTVRIGRVADEKKDTIYVRRVIGR